jgi:hypothetical protein
LETADPPLNRSFFCILIFLETYFLIFVLRALLCSITQNEGGGGSGNKVSRYDARNGYDIISEYTKALVEKMEYYANGGEKGGKLPGVRRRMAALTECN